jgi:hypothetical protein
MFISNLVKLLGCVAMLFGVNPLYSYALVGLGAAAYSPAKYGILTEYLPSSLLVVANSWMEGLTVLAIIMGAVLGGLILNEHFWAYGSFNHLLESLMLPTINSPQFSILIVLVLYILAALFNLKIPQVKLDHKLKNNHPFYIILDFARSFKMLWQDPLGKVSLAVTTLFWGVGSTLRLIVLVWAGLQLHFSLEQATQITAVSAIGIAIGAIAAAKLVTLENSLKVLPVGIAMGFAIFGMLFIHDWHKAIALLILAGAMGGFFVVPMNALLQHRGHQLMGAGHSIAVQNFNENISILLMMGVYALVIRADQPLNRLYHFLGIRHFKEAILLPSEAAFYTSVILLAGFISGVMYWLYRRYRHVNYID